MGVTSFVELTPPNGTLVHFGCGTGRDSADRILLRAAADCHDRILEWADSEGQISKGVAGTRFGTNADSRAPKRRMAVQDGENSSASHSITRQPSAAWRPRILRERSSAPTWLCVLPERARFRFARQQQAQPARILAKPSAGQAAPANVVDLETLRSWPAPFPLLPAAFGSRPHRTKAPPPAQPGPRWNSRNGLLHGNVRSPIVRLTCAAPLGVPRRRSR